MTDLKSSKIVILGTHPDSLLAFDPVVHARDEIWGMAHHNKTLLHATRAFEAHSPEIVFEHGGNGHIQRLTKIAHEIPLFTMWPWPLELGPMHKVVTASALADQGVVRWRQQDWNNTGEPIGSTPFIESSIGYIMAMALREAMSTPMVSDIYLYGINMSGSDEYTYQRPNICYLIGKAEGMGIKVHTPAKCSIFSSQWTGRVYGHPKNIHDIIYYLKPEGAPKDDE